MELLENHWKAPVTIQNRTVDAADETPAAVDRHLIIAYRKMKKESQRRFWARFGVTQSRGSRFESGAEIPPPVSILLGLYFLKTISDGDLGRAERVIYSRDAAALLNPGQ
jgi:RsaL-like HTH domain